MYQSDAQHTVIAIGKVRDHVSVHSVWLSMEAPKFVAALTWPEGPTFRP